LDVPPRNRDPSGLESTPTAPADRTYPPTSRRAWLRNTPRICDRVTVASIDEIAVSQMQATYERLDWWAVRGRNGEKPMPGSALARDGAIWPYLPLHEVAHWALVAAVDHLNLVRAAFDSGRGPGTAEFTALRGALVGASRAVWLLESDSAQVRQQRCLRIVHEWYARHLEWTGEHDVSTLSEADAALLAHQRDWTADRRDLVRALWEDTDGCPAATGPRHNPWPNQTSVLRQAALFTFRDARKVESVMREWRVTSGDAHALSWATATRIHQMQRPDSNGVRS